MAVSNIVSMSKILNASANANQTFLKKLLAALAKMWGEFDGWYDDDAVEQAAKQAAETEMKVLKQVQRMSIASANQMLRQAGVLPDITDVPELEHPRDVDLVELWSRPAEQYRYQIHEGKGTADALVAALGRMASIAQTDTVLTNRNAKILQFRRNGVRKYRRMIHPEKSKSGVCGLCLVAADRIYGTDDLLPIHDGCNCDVAPITATNDPGLRLSTSDLQELYAAAGNSTSGHDLKRLRIKTVENSEIGPVLVAVGGKDYVTPDEAQSRRRKKKPVLKSIVDDDSPTALKKKSYRTPEESKRLLALSQMKFDSYDAKIKDLLAEGVNGDDPRLTGSMWGRRRMEQEIKTYQKELAKAVEAA